MRTYAVIADTHGNYAGASRVLESLGSAAGLIHLGDGVRDGEKVAAEWRVPFFGVYGNEDYGSKQPERLIMEVEGWRILLIHGHQFDLNPYLPALEWEERLLELAGTARAAGAQALLFGHTHRPLAEIREGTLLGNPGNQYSGSSRPPTFGWLSVGTGRLEFGIAEREPCKENRDGMRVLLECNNGD